MTNVAIVTGGSKGIGKAIVERLAREAYIVYNLILHHQKVTTATVMSVMLSR